jgi:hypothetical protein
MSDATTGSQIDILSAPPPGPALSTTSDTPTAPVAPDPAPPPPAAAPEPAATPEPEPASGDDGAEPGEPTAPAAAPSRFGQRLSELTAARRAAEEARAAADARVDKLTALVEKLTATQTPAEPEPVVAPKPMREQFADPDAYDEALVAWAVQRGAGEAAQRTAQEFERRQHAEREAQEVARRTEAERQQFDGLRTSYAEKRAKLLEDPAYADFELVAEDEKLPITDTMLPPLLLADNGPAVLYHLGKHHDEAARIAALNPMLQAMEIAKISARLAIPDRPQPSRLPRPMAPVGGNNAAAPKSPGEMTTEEYAAYRTPQLQNERRAGMWGMVKQS